MVIHNTSSRRCNPINNDEIWITCITCHMLINASSGACNFDTPPHGYCDSTYTYAHPGLRVLRMSPAQTGGRNAVNRETCPVSRSVLRLDIRRTSIMRPIIRRTHVQSHTGTDCNLLRRPPHGDELTQLYTKTAVRCKSLTGSEPRPAAHAGSRRTILVSTDDHGHACHREIFII